MACAGRNKRRTQPIPLRDLSGTSQLIILPTLMESAIVLGTCDGPHYEGPLGEVTFNIGERALQIGQNLRAKPHHPRRAVGVAVGAERYHELAEVVTRVKHLHGRSQRGFAIVDE